MQERLGLDQASFQAALRTVDPDDVTHTGGLTEAEYFGRYASALRLSPGQARQFAADLWDWYCGELDQEMVSYVTRLRSRLLTGILSNSPDGARREEQARYALPELVDVTLLLARDRAGQAGPAGLPGAVLRAGGDPGRAGLRR